MEEDIILTDEQKAKILELWRATPQAPPFLRDLAKAVFGQEADGRDRRGKVIKEFLSQQNLVAKPAKAEPLEEIVLTDEQKDYISNNASMMTALDMAKELFHNPMLSNLHRETRAVNEYIKTLPKNVVFGNTDDVPSEALYKAPRTFDRMLFKINRYVHEGIDKEKITARQKKEINALINYMNTYRFGHQINTYTSQADRDLFESSFIRYTYDKSDLTQEEVDQYIVLSTEVVISSSIQASIVNLQNLLETAAGDDRAKISTNLVEAINVSRTEYNQCVGRSQKLLNDLKQKRSDRIKTQISENASINNLFQLFKEEKTRKELLQLAERRKEVLADEIDKITSMDDVLIRVMGISKDEVLNG